MSPGRPKTSKGKRAYARGGGPPFEVFGRLADGVVLEQARAKLPGGGRRMAAAYPDTHEHLRPLVLPYAHALYDIDNPGFARRVYIAQFAFSLLLVVIAVNVAVLVYARTATRAGEIAVRTALGASRTRVIAQLFVEAAVLSATAAAAGLALAVVTLGFVERFLETVACDYLPFWFDLALDVDLVTYVIGLALLGAAVVGVLPALRATGRDVRTGLQQLAARGSRMQLGRTWTTLIVAQVAVAVAVMPASIFYAEAMLRDCGRDPGYAISDFVHASLTMDHEAAPAGTDAAPTIPPSARGSGTAPRHSCTGSMRSQAYVSRSRHAIRLAEGKPGSTSIARPPPPTERPATRFSNPHCIGWASTASVGVCSICSTHRSSPAAGSPKAMRGPHRERLSWTGPSPTVLPAAPTSSGGGSATHPGATLRRPEPPARPARGSRSWASWPTSRPRWCDARHVKLKHDEPLDLVSSGSDALE